ncbi:MAG: type III-B CRISPR module RAMP protein Cmr4 [Chitinophagales bacterium]
MYKIARPLFLHCQTAMHAGTGDDLGIVDLPIQREKHTGYPKIEASGLKGAIRESFEENATSVADRVKLHVAFGYDEKDASRKPSITDEFKDKESRDFAGTIGFTDARIVLFPLKSLKGIFAYATCPSVLKKLKQELQDICQLSITIETDFNSIDVTKVAVANASHLSSNNKAILEEYSFDCSDTDLNKKAKELAKQLNEILGITDLENKLVVLEDDTFADFVKNSTEVVTRIKIDNETGTVAKGALFTEEYLPTECVMYSLVLASNVFAPSKKDKFDKGEYLSVMNYFADTLNNVIQIGGNATLGKGIVKTIKTQLKQSNDGDTATTQA